jgi:hypothetical protein
MILPMAIMISACHPGPSACETVKTGTFSYRSRKTGRGHELKRDKIFQTEIDLETRDSFFYKITWINDCKYNLRYLHSRKTLGNAEKKFRNSYITSTEILSVKKNITFSKQHPILSP